MPDQFGRKCKGYRIVPWGVALGGTLPCEHRQKTGKCPDNPPKRRNRMKLEAGDYTAEQLRELADKAEEEKARAAIRKWRRDNDAEWKFKMGEENWAPCFDGEVEKWFGDGWVKSQSPGLFYFETEEQALACLAALPDAWNDLLRRT